MAKDEPQINISPESVFCKLHGELFRPHWPDGYLLFAVTLFHDVPMHPDVERYCGKDASKLDAAVAEFGPMCGLVSPERRLLAYQKAGELGIWEHGRCASCGEMREGGNYTHDHLGIVRTDFICLQCVSDHGCGS